MFLCLGDYGLVRGRSFLSSFGSSLVGACGRLRGGSRRVVGLLGGCGGRESFCCSVETIEPRGRVRGTTVFVCLGHASCGNVCEIGESKLCGIPFKCQGKGGLLSYDGFSEVDSLLSRGIAFRTDSFRVMERGVGPCSLIFLSPPCAMTRRGGNFMRCGRRVFS